MDQLPDKPALLRWISENPTLTAKRDIARAFAIKGSAARIELKRLLPPPVEYPCLPKCALHFCKSNVIFASRPDWWRMAAIWARWCFPMRY